MCNVWRSNGKLYALDLGCSHVLLRIRPGGSGLRRRRRDHFSISPIRVAVGERIRGIPGIDPGVGCTVVGVVNDHVRLTVTIHVGHFHQLHPGSPE